MASFVTYQEKEEDDDDDDDEEEEKRSEKKGGSIMKTTLFCLCVAPSIFILHRRNKIVTEKKFHLLLGHVN